MSDLEDKQADLKQSKKQSLEKDKDTEVKSVPTPKAFFTKSNSQNQMRLIVVLDNL